MRINIRRATLDDLDVLAPLFDAYRGFHDQPSNPAGARAFLAARIGNDESIVLIAVDDMPGRHGGDNALGFTQLYPMFSSVGMARMWLLNDLFVSARARRRGVGAALLRAAADIAHDDGALRLELETGVDNAAAQALYRAVGWQPCDGVMRFQLPLAV